VKATALKQVTYDPSIFTEIETVDDAMRIIVTPEAGMTTQHRWEVETKYLMALIERWITPQSTVLDYGCGIGRLAKPLIEKLDCDVIGIDASPNMRALAASCVTSDQFMALPPDMIDYISARMCHYAIAIWTLKHVLEPKNAVHDIEISLMSGGKLFVVNNVRRVVPSTVGWLDDGIDVRAVLQDHFTELEFGKLEGDDVAPGTFKDNTFWALYQK